MSRLVSFMSGLAGRLTAAADFGLARLARAFSPLELQDGRCLRLLVIVGALLFLFSNGVVDMDDAPITYRYAQNLADGKGFVYNEGERLQGTTTPGFTLLLAALHRLSSLDMPALSNVLGLAFSVATLGVTYKFVLGITASALTALFAGLFLATLGPFAAWSMAGMETPMYSFLLMSCLYLHQCRQWLALGLAGGALVVTRIDGLVLVGVLGLWMTAALLSGRLSHRDYLKTLAPFLALALAWFAFAYLYFGALVPHSLTGKQGHPWLASEWWPFAHFVQRKYLFLLPALLWLPFLAFKDRQHPAILLAAFVLLYLLAYLLAGIDFYEWYIVPLMPVFALLFTLSLEPLKRHSLPLLAVVGPLLLVHASHLYWDVTSLKAHINERFEVNRALAGKWLNAHVSTEASLHTGTVGHIGWHFRGRIIDGSRLVSGWDGAFTGDLVLTGEPDFADSTFVAISRDYQLIKSFPHPIAPLHIWLRPASAHLLKPPAAP